MPEISIHKLYQRFRLLIHEGFRFLVVGGAGAVVTIVGAVALHGLGKYVAVTIATIAATVVTFLGNRYWTFSHRQGRGTAHETVAFFLLNGVGLVIYYACIGLMQDVMGLDGKVWYTIALVIGTGLGTVFRFWSYRKWVWILQPRPSLAAAGPAGYADPAMVGRIAGRAIQVGGLGSARLSADRPTGRHAGAPRGAAGRSTTIRNSPGAHRRS